MALNINKDNYHRYKKIFLVITTCFNESLEKRTGVKLPPEADVSYSLEKAEKKGMTYAIRGLKESVQEYIRQFDDMPWWMIKKIESVLRKEGLPSMSQLQVLVNDSVKKIVKRGKIRNEEEYYLIMEILNDTTSELTDKEHEQLNKAVSEFELRK